MKKTTVRSVLYKNQQWLNNSDLIVWLTTSAANGTWGEEGREFASSCALVLAETREQALSPGKAKSCAT